MIIADNTNPFPSLCDVYIDAANPIANASSVPINGASLTNVIDLGINRTLNTFTQNTDLLKPTFQRSLLKPFEYISFNGDDNQYMLCPFSNPANNYVGPMTITIGWMTLDTTLSSNRRIFGRQGYGGFSIGQVGNGYVFTLNGQTDLTGDSNFDENVWQMASFRFDNVDTLTFFTNGVNVGSTSDGVPLLPITADMILGGYDSSATGINWLGGMMILGWSFRLLTDNQIKRLHYYGMNRLGI